VEELIPTHEKVQENTKMVPHYQLRLLGLKKS